jgi:hypothetical protein
MIFDPARPFYDGLLYSDLWMLRDRRHHNILAARGVVYLTEFRSPEGVVYCGDIIAKNRCQAERVAFGRGLGEVIQQRMSKIIY